MDRVTKGRKAFLEYWSKLATRNQRAFKKSEHDWEAHVCLNCGK